MENNQVLSNLQDLVWDPRVSKDFFYALLFEKAFAVMHQKNLHFDLIFVREEECDSEHLLGGWRFKRRARRA